MGISCWFGHHWKTVDEYKVEGGKKMKLGPMEGPAFLIQEIIDKAMGGYKVIHQECIRCGERRSFHKW